MKPISVLACLLALAASSAWAQTPASTVDVDAERSRIADERKAVEARYDQDRAVCYKKFAVQDCLNDVRRKRRTQVEDLNRQEAIINDGERARRAAAQLDDLERKGKVSAEDAAKRESALQSQKDREQRAADYEASRKAKEAEAAANRRAFESKQKAHAQEQAQQAQRRSQDEVERQRYEEKLKRAAQDRVELEERNAKRTKPRSAPLPTPP